jgi:hypothetical protein
LDIQRAVSAINDSQTGSHCPIDKPSVIPQDRSRVWPAVVEKRNEFGWNNDDENLLIAQLGYLPGNAIRVTCRRTHSEELTGSPHEESSTGNDDPVVVQLYPIVLREEYSGGKSDGRKFKGRKRQKLQPLDDDQQGTSGTIPMDGVVLEPFPTMYWLVNPLLRAQISKLEVEGYGANFQQRLAENSDELARMKRAHDAYGKERLDLLTTPDRQLIQSRRWESAFAIDRGVAGIRNFGSVKCLHAHTAHYLSGNSDNLIGQWVMEAIASKAEVGTNGVAALKANEESES